MMRIALRLVFLSSILLVFGTSSAAEPELFPGIKQIVDSGVLRVAMLDKDIPPLIMTASNGTLTGSEPDLARDLAQKMGVNIKFIRTADTYDGVVDVVARKQADIAVSYLTGGVHRGLYVYFSQPYIQQNARLFYNRKQYAKLHRDYDISDLHAINVLPIASKLTIGVEAGSVNKTILKRDFPNLALKTFTSLDEIITAVKEDKIFAGMHGSLRTHYYLRRNPATAIYVAIDSNIRLPSDIRIAVRPDAPDLLRWVDLYLANHVGILEHEDILRRYLGKEK